jgi:hypothetical protein
MYDKFECRVILWANICFRKTIYWLKLSNSGEILKFLIPNYSRKVISGWSNYSGMVITQKISEKIMDNRGSKSEFNLDRSHKKDLMLSFVKEQRVDGSWPLSMKANSTKIERGLRCTLIGLEKGCRSFYNGGLLSNIFESNKNKILTKVSLSKNYNTLAKCNLDPWFLTGFSDAEGSFIISIYRDEKSKFKWRVSAYFSIHIHVKDVLLLEQIHKTFGVGTLRKNNENTVLFRVSDIKELQTIIDHFKNYPLVSPPPPHFFL